MDLQDLPQEQLDAMTEQSAAQEYKALRQQAYPSIADQLDTIFHDGLDAWKAQIQAVKDQFPKPGA